MAQDLYIKQGTGFHDLYLEDDTTIVLCPDVQSLVRQRVAIQLKTIYGEWFANRNFGVPYFESIVGKNTQDTADAILRTTITDTEGVIRLIEYESTNDSRLRTLSVRFRAETESGVIEEEVTV